MPVPSLFPDSDNLSQLIIWKLKDGYEYLEDFVNLLQIRGVVDPIRTRRSLKGITDPVPFSDKALRRYYNHIMAYVDPKEASKSEDKHRLYLGMLSGPVYPEAVIYHYRERLLDQITALCAELGKEAPLLDAIRPPIQGNAFESDEVSSILNSTH
jgi:hypothetical protein